MAESTGLHLNHLTFVRILSIDVGDLMTARGSLDRRFGVDHALALASKVAERMGAAAPEIAQSMLGRFERLDRSTLPPAITREFAPWRINIDDDLGQTGDVALALKSWDFYRVGVVQLVYAGGIQTSDHQLPIRELIPALSAARDCIEVDAEERLSELADAFGVGSRNEGDMPYVDRCLTYELIDFRLTDSKGPAWPRNVLAGRDTAARELAGLLRMSRAGAWTHYSDSTLDKVLSGGLGYRDDDFFYVSGRRVLRHHPDSRQDVAEWFDDLCLAVGIMLATETFLEFSSRMLADTSLFIGDDKVHPAVDGPEKLVLSETVLSRVADPFVFERMVGHSFFRELLVGIRDSLGLHELHSLVRSRVEQVRTGLDYMIQTRFSSAAARSAQRAEWIGIAVVALTIITLVVGTVQIVVALEGGGTTHVSSSSSSERDHRGEARSAPHPSLGQR